MSCRPGAACPTRPREPVSRQPRYQDRARWPQDRREMPKSRAPGRPAPPEGSRAGTDHCVSFIALARAILGFFGEHLYHAVCYVPVVGRETVVMPVKLVGARQPIKLPDP